MTHALAITFAVLGIAFVTWGSWPVTRWPRKGNVRINLSPPADACRRTNPMNDTPTRSIP